MFDDSNGFAAALTIGMMIIVAVFFSGCTTGAQFCAGVTPITAIDNHQQLRPGAK